MLTCHVVLLFGALIMRLSKQIQNLQDYILDEKINNSKIIFSSNLDALKIFFFFSK